MGWDQIFRGTKGDDFISGGSGDDLLQGRAGSDTLDGGDGNDVIQGDEGDDHLRGGAGDDFINGGTGIDSAYYSGSILEYSHYRDGENFYLLHFGGAGLDGSDRLIHVERLVFADAVIDLTQNNAPIAFADSASTDEDVGTYSSGSASVLDNDFDWEGDSLSVAPATFNGIYGTLVLNADGTYSYTPYASNQSLAQGQSVQDSFSYTVSDGSLTDTGTLTITIAGLNDAPVANPDADTTGENQTILIDVLANDTDVDNGAVLIVASASAPSGQGTATVVGNQVEFDPGTDFDYLDDGESAQVVVSYTIEDEHGAESTSTITITVNGLNDAPVANDDTASTTEDDSISGNVLANDTDVDGETLTVTNPATYIGAYGTLVLAADGSYTYTPSGAAQTLDEGESANDVFNYTVSDGTASDSATLTITVTGLGGVPDANDDTASTTEDASVSGNVLTNDTDDEGDPLTVSNPGIYVGTYGTLTLAADGSYTYAPNAAQNGLAAGESVQDVFNYTATDGTGSDSATLTVTVNGTNDAPTIDAGGTDASGSVTELPDGDPDEGTAVHTDSGTVAFDDVDLSDTHTASFTPQGGGYLGTFTLDPVDDLNDSVGWDFSVSDAALEGLSEGQVVTQTYTVQIDDGNGGTVTQNVTITLTGAGVGTGPQTVWYIDNSALGSANLGTQADPYTSIAAFNAAQGTFGGPQVGANVFLLAGTGTGVYAEADGINLLDDQVLTGVATGPIRPTIAPAAGNGVDLAENNALSGFDVVTTASTGILDASAAAGSVTISDVNVTSTSGVAISLSSAANVSIANATIVSTGNYAISGVSVAGFALTDSIVTGGPGSDAAIAFTGLTGIAALLGNLLGGGGDTLRIVNGSGALDLTIADSGDNQAVFGHTNLDGNDSVLIATGGSASLTLTVDGVDFTGARGDLLQTVAGGNSTHDLTITGNSFHNSHANISSGGGGVHIGGAGANIAVDYAVVGNSFRGADGNALSAIFTPAAGTIRGLIEGNVVGINDGVAGSEGSSGGGDGIVVGIEKAGGPGTLTHTLTLIDNEVYDIAFGLAGISLRSSGGGAGNGAVLEAVVSGNTVAELGDFTAAAFYALVGGSAGSGDFARLGLDMTDNVFDASDADFGFNAVLLDQLSTDAHFYFPGYAGSADGEGYGGTASDDIAAYLAAQGNALVDPPFGFFPGGVYAEFVTGVTGDLFTLPAWP